MSTQDVSSRYANPVTVCLCGDVMVGRGIDQVLPYASDPRLYEAFMKSAGGYVELAEQAHGPIPRHADFSYIWGDALAEVRRCAPDLRIVNLETSLTMNSDYAPKGINYRMHPNNAGCLKAMGIDCCNLANNHVLDWSTDGLLETLNTLDQINIAHAGAGRTWAEAAAPAILHTQNDRRVLVFGFGMSDSGIPHDWAATEDRPGINFLDAYDDRVVPHAIATVGAARRSDDLVIASIHWGGNWGYDVPEHHRRLAHAMIDSGVIDLVHGHSSHHAKGIEIYRDRLILYGCGDFVNDYEGIGGYEEYRGDLTVAYVAKFPPDSGLIDLSLIPFQIRNFRLNRAVDEDVLWLQRALERESAQFGTHIVANEGRTLRVIPSCSVPGAEVRPQH